MSKQITKNILMIEPVAFSFNEETAENNYFQEESKLSNQETQRQALKEFQEMVAGLQSNEIQVITVKDTLIPHTPDSIFPNNWISFHSDGQIALYPMYATNRRTERREDILETLEQKGFKISDVTDYTEAEKQNVFLEGTGSMILDRENKLCYACLSDRTHQDLLLEFCEDFDYEPVIFNANQTVNEQRVPIYHTNVMMCVANEYVVICLDSIDDEMERNFVIETIQNSGKEIVEISEEQMHQFAGNMLQVENDKETPFLVMSTCAYNSLNQNQIEKLESYNQILHYNISTIETNGGGSVRCMMAEVFNPID